MINTAIQLDQMNKFMRFSAEYEIRSETNQYRASTEYAVFKNGKKVEEKSFPYPYYDSFVEHFKEVKAWVDTVLNPNLKIFKHIKF